MSKKSLSYFKKINVSEFLGRTRQRWSVMSASGAVLKSLGARNFCASVNDAVALESKIILTTDDWLTAQTSIGPSLHL